MAPTQAIIIGAGPAGLTMAYELLKKSDIRPIIYESSGEIGGIARTVCHNGNRMDIGGHRFFSKSDLIMRWWLDILPQQDDRLGPACAEKVMLLRKRHSRILFKRKLFNYPLTLDFKSFRDLGVQQTAKILLSYVRSKILPIRKEKNLEDFFVNRFGKELYAMFFKSYTEKVWGAPCSEIDPQWGAQRIKALSLFKTMLHVLKRGTFSQYPSARQHSTDTSLIEYFLYPKYGPGQLWEEMASYIRQRGGIIHLWHTVTGFKHRGNRITEVEIEDKQKGNTVSCSGEYFISTMPVKNLIRSFQGDVPPDVKRIASGLLYRDFIIIGLLLKRLKVHNNGSTVPDNWIYIQEPDVKLSRIQIYNNWSPYLVKNKDTVWIGAEYHCNEKDEIWKASDKDNVALAARELSSINFINEKDVLDSVVIRVPKAYPVYSGAYNQFDVIRSFTDTFENLFLIGRNGMHRYNNMDHSMLTAMAATENIIHNVKNKENIWALDI